MPITGITKRNFRKSAINFLLNIAGLTIYSLGVHVFNAPNEIAPGGLTGLSTLLNYLTGFPIGVAVLLMNAPLLILAYFYSSRSYAVKTLTSIVLFTVILDVFFKDLPVYSGNKMLAALFGGVLIGFGIAVVYSTGSSTGGTDIIGMFLRQKFPYMKFGRIVFLVDMVIILLSIVVYRNLETAMYATISIFAMSKVVDGFLYGLDRGYMLMIVSKEHAKISREIMEKLERGATILKGQGAFSGSDQSVIMCAVAKMDFYRLKDIIKSIDKTAFIIVTDVGEVLGEGFKSIQ